jgi:hypothetical protein
MADSSDDERNVAYGGKTSNSEVPKKGLWTPEVCRRVLTILGRPNLLTGFFHRKMNNSCRCIVKKDVRDGLKSQPEFQVATISNVVRDGTIMSILKFAKVLGMKMNTVLFWSNTTNKVTIGLRLQSFYLGVLVLL